MSETTVTVCCCCGQPHRVETWQATAKRPAFNQVTCDTPGCQLSGFTFAQQGYEQRDFTAYLRPRTA